VPSALRRGSANPGLFVRRGQRGHACPEARHPGLPRSRGPRRPLPERRFVMANGNAEPQAEPSTLDDKVRKDLVQVFFGLVLTQIAVYIASLIELWDVRGEFNADFMAAWFHIILGFTLTTTSWFGWQISVRNTKLTEEASIFQGGF